MNIIRFLTVAVAALLSFVPAGWMAIFTLGALGYVGGNPFQMGAWLVFVALLACLLGYVSAFVFCIRAWKRHSLSVIQSPALIIGLALGVAGLLCIVGGFSDETIAGILSRREGAALTQFLFFISPTAIFMLAGMICAAHPDETKSEEPAAAEQVGAKAASPPGSLDR